MHSHLSVSDCLSIVRGRRAMKRGEEIVPPAVVATEIASEVLMAATYAHGAAAPKRRTTPTTLWRARLMKLAE